MEEVRKVSLLFLGLFGILLLFISFMLSSNELTGEVVSSSDLVLDISFDGSEGYDLKNGAQIDSEVLSLDGEDDYISLNTKPDFTKPYTVFMWIKLNDWSKRDRIKYESQTLIQQRCLGCSDGSKGAMIVGIPSLDDWNSVGILGDKYKSVGDKIAFMAGRDSSNKDKWVFGDTVIGEDRWYPVAVVYDGTNAKVYVNGDLEGNENVGSLVSGFNSELAVGGVPSGVNSGWKNFNGEIDSFKIYQRALSDSEITELSSARIVPVQDDIIDDCLGGDCDGELPQPELENVLFYDSLTSLSSVSGKGVSYNMQVSADGSGMSYFSSGDGLIVTKKDFAVPYSVSWDLVNVGDYHSFVLGSNGFSDGAVLVVIKAAGGEVRVYNWDDGWKLENRYSAGFELSDGDKIKLDVVDDKTIVGYKNTVRIGTIKLVKGVVSGGFGFRDYGGNEAGTVKNLKVVGEGTEDEEIEMGEFCESGECPPEGLVETIELEAEDATINNGEISGEYVSLSNNGGYIEYDVSNLNLDDGLPHIIWVKQKSSSLFGYKRSYYAEGANNVVSREVEAETDSDEWILLNGSNGGMMLDDFGSKIRIGAVRAYGFGKLWPLSAEIDKVIITNDIYYDPTEDEPKPPVVYDMKWLSLTSKADEDGFLIVNLFGENLHEGFDVVIDGMRNPEFIVNKSVIDESRIELKINSSDALFEDTFPEFFYTVGLEYGGNQPMTVGVYDKSGEFVSSVEDYVTPDHEFGLVPAESSVVGTGNSIVTVFSTIRLILNAGKFLDESVCLERNAGVGLIYVHPTVFEEDCNGEIYEKKKLTEEYEWLSLPNIGNVGLCYLSATDDVEEKRDCKSIGGKNYVETYKKTETVEFESKITDVEKLLNSAARIFLNINIFPPWETVEETNQEWDSCRTDCIYHTDENGWVTESCSSPSTKTPDDYDITVNKPPYTTHQSKQPYAYVSKKTREKVTYNPRFEVSDILGWRVERLLSVDKPVDDKRIFEVKLGDGCVVESYEFEREEDQVIGEEVSEWSYESKGKASYDFCHVLDETTRAALRVTPALTSFKADTKVTTDGVEEKSQYIIQSKRDKDVKGPACIYDYTIIEADLI